MVGPDARHGRIRTSGGVGSTALVTVLGRDVVEEISEEEFKTKWSNERKANWGRLMLMI